MITIWNSLLDCFENENWRNHAMYMKNYEDGDEEKIIPLLQRVFTRGQFDLELWNWQYKQNPSGFFNNIWMMIDNDEVVGHYAIIPQRMIISGRQCLGAQSLQTATHESYRRRGIFKKLAEKTYQQAKERGILIIYGFAVEASYYGFVKYLEWKYFFALPQMITILNIDEFFEDAKTSKFLFKLRARFKRKRKEIGESPLKIEQVSRFDEEYESFWNQNRKHFEVITVRDSAYLNWRFVDRPYRTYENFICRDKKGDVGGYVVLRTKIKEKKGFILDLLAKNDAISEDLINWVITYYKSRNINAVYTNLSRDNIYSKQFKKCGFMDWGAPSFANQLIARINIENSLTSIFHNIDGAKWFITPGDSDTA